MTHAMICTLASAACSVVSHRCFSNSLPNDSLFTVVLQQHVLNGVVDYEGIKRDPRFAQYIDQLRTVDTATVRPSERLTFWINMYNAWTIKVVIDNYPVKSIIDVGAGLVIGTIFGTTVWDKDVVQIKGASMSLNDIEHKIVRKYGDARVHFALVCASKSCPPLRREAYDASRLDEQLDEQSRIFLNDSTKNKIELNNNTIYLSKIFDWFEGDFERDTRFGKGKGTVIQFIARFLPEQVSAKLLAEDEQFNVEYFDYDWTLNE